MKGKFIVVEGVDFTGKTTQIKMIKTFLEENNIPHIVTREPGGTKLGEMVRDIVLETKTEEPTKEAILLLFMASRAENINKIIIPAINSGKTVICDRFLASTLVYQGVLSGFKREDILIAHQNFNYNLYPDLSILLDAKTEILLERKTIQNTERHNNKYDFLPTQIFERLREEFLKTTEILELNTKVVSTESTLTQTFDEIKKLISICLNI